MRLLTKKLRDQAPKWVKTTVLIAAGVAALYVGGLRPVRMKEDLATERATGLAEFQPTSFWQRGALGRFVDENASVGDKLQRVQMASLTEPASAPSPIDAPDNADRKMVRTDSLDLVVQHPADTAEQISELATRLGGFLVTSDVSGDPDVPSASLTIRIPVARFEEARSEIRKLGLRADSERVEAQDVTRQYVDQEAHLRNLRAEEAQYLAILKHAATVKDTLEVSEKLGEVRGNIEQQQAEFEALSKQVETVAITISLRADADTQVMGLHWRPLYRLKTAARNGLDSLGDYLATMTSLAFFLPTILFWLATFLFGAAVGWRILRWSARLLFAFPKPAVTEKGAN